MTSKETTEQTNKVNIPSNLSLSEDNNGKESPPKKSESRGIPSVRGRRRPLFSTTTRVMNVDDLFLVVSTIIHCISQR